MTDSVLVIGGGIAGLSAAQYCAAAGASAIVVERDAVVGGRLAAAMTGRSSVGDDIDGTPVPKLAALGENQRIEILTLSELQALEGRPGDFRASIVQRQRFVTDDCTRCNRCRPVCPVVLPNEHDAGLTYRKAIDSPLAETLPQAFVIDIDSCLNTPPNYLPCNRCTEVCDDDAIHFEQALQTTLTRQIGAVIVATGFSSSLDEGAKERGYGSHPDIVTTREMERMLLAPGPTGGFAAKPSNEEYPDRLLFVLDLSTRFEVQTVVSQMRRLADQGVGAIECLITEQEGVGDSPLAADLPGVVTVHHGLLTRIEAEDDARLAARWAAFSNGKVVEERFDMVVLGDATQPPTGLDSLAALLGIELQPATGYIATPDEPGSCTTSRPGIYVAGGVVGPTLLADAAAQAQSAAAAAVAQLDPRLLDAASRPGDQAVPISADIGEAELKARIEGILRAMLENQE